LPSLSFTPGLYRFTGGTGFFNGLDYTPYVASFTGGNVSLGVSLETGLLGEDVKLDRHSRGDAIVDKDGSPSMREQIREQRNLEAIEAAFRNQQAQIDTLEVIVAQLQAVINAQAQTAAQVASVEADIALANSKTVPVDGLLSATSDGVINISAHDRDYADGSAPVAVDAGSISGFTEGQFVRVYYLDAAREGGAVSYIGTIDEVTQTGTIHVVGGVTIPMIGDPPSTGTGTTPPGYVRTLPE
jgi:hypothetical protein